MSRVTTGNLPDIFKKKRGQPPCRLVLFKLQIFYIFEKIENCPLKNKADGQSKHV